MKARINVIIPTNEFTINERNTMLTRILCLAFTVVPLYLLSIILNKFFMFRKKIASHKKLLFWYNLIVLIVAFSFFWVGYKYPSEEQYAVFRYVLMGIGIGVALFVAPNGDYTKVKK